MADVRRAITTTNKPFIIKNRLGKWPISNLSESQWCEIFSSKELTFRKGHQGYSEGPRWESTCEQVKMSLDQFFEASKKDSNEWLYYDYKDMSTVFGEDNITEGVRWGDVGYPEVSGRESTLWIGNVGAHTPCHMDSYGYNLVAQLYGRKLWILIPPEETNNLRATRVPYEESSVYSELDFYTPSYDILNLTKVYKVIVEAGQVLYVPHHWWHYVENLEVAITVNTWIPSEHDDESRVEEALVQRLVWSICHELTPQHAQTILNPNEMQLLSNPPTDLLLHTIAAKCREARSKKSEKSKSRRKSALNKDISVVPMATAQIMRQYVSEKIKKFGYNPPVGFNTPPPLDAPLTSKMLINAFCHPETVAIAKEKLMASFAEFGK